MRKFSLLALVFVVFIATLNAEYFVRIKNVTPQDILKLEKSGYFSTQDFRQGILTGIAYDLSILKNYNYRIIFDFDSMRTHVWSKYKDQYHSYQSFVQDFVNLAQTYPALTKLDTIGYSVQGRLILALKISDNPDIREFEPEVRIVGTHHGNEWISTEIPILLAHYLLENYGNDTFVTRMVNEREIWIIPMLNPDGHEAQQRRNANYVDINRDYGYMWGGEGSSPEPYSQPETRSIYEFSQKHNFVLSLSYHSYGEIVNYIWNYSPHEPPDSLLVRNLSQGYASFNGYSVTEGYDWYQTLGDLNDYSYGIDADIDWTIELATEFIPPASQINSIWLQNRNAIMYIIEKAGQGIGGFVIDSITGDTIKEARIKVSGIDWPVFTDPISGDFVKVLLPGTYSIEVEANGYRTKTINNISVSPNHLTHVDVYLTPEDNGIFAYKYVYTTYTDETNSFNNHTLSPWALGPPDGKYYSIGVGGEVVLDMGKSHYLHGGFTVYEAQTSDGPEGYTVQVSNNWNGPWVSLGSATGTHTFSLTGTGLDSVRYIKIRDDGDGNVSEPDPGFDLDAVGVLSGPIISINYQYMGPDSQNISSGDTIKIWVTLKNSGNEVASSVYAVLRPEDQYVTVIDSEFDYGDIEVQDSVTKGPYEAVLSDDLPAGYLANLTLHVVGQNFSPLNFTIQIPVYMPVDYIVWDPDPNHSSGPVIDSLLKLLGLNGIYTTSLQNEFSLLRSAKALFICLGIYSDNFVIQNGSPEADSIASFLNVHHGNVYMEGGDVWYYDPTIGGYDFGPLFGINAVSDGSGDLNVVNGVSGSFAQGLSFNYSGENNYIDHIEPENGSFAILEKGDGSYYCGIAYDNGNYKTVGLSFEFSGLVDQGDNTKLELMRRIVGFFGISNVEESGIRNGILPELKFTKGNIFRSSPEFEVYMPQDANVKIRIFDITGRRVYQKVFRLNSGRNFVTLKFRNRLNAGVYFVEVKTKKRILKGKFLILH